MRPDLLSSDSGGLVGKVVERYEYEQRDGLKVFFADGSVLVVGSTMLDYDDPGIEAALMLPDDPLEPPWRDPKWRAYLALVGERELPETGK